MLIWLRSCIFSLGYIPSTVLYGTLSLFLRLVPQKICHRIIVTWCSFMMHWMRWTIGIRYQLIGADNLKKIRAPVVVLSKHQSTWETLFLQIVFFPAVTVAKQELLKVPFFGWGLQGLQTIAIDRDNPRFALKQVKEGGLINLKKGNNFLLFPEGTRVKLGERGKYARSGADIAIEAGVDVVPVALNSGKCWPPKHLRKFPGLISVVIGEPIPTQGKTSRELTDQVEEWIESELATIAERERVENIR